MTKCIERRPVKLVDIRRDFARLAGESRADMRRRLLVLERRMGEAGGKVAAYEQRMARGAAFPPIFLFEEAGEYYVDDGWHRCAAASLRGCKTISAVVFAGLSGEQENALSAWLFDLEWDGATWQERVRAARAWLKSGGVVLEAAA